MLIALSFLFSALVHADTLDIVSVAYRPEKQAVSCGLLRQRELEREKVIREIQHLKGDALISLNNLLTNKLFMPKEVWRDLSVAVEVEAKIPEAMLTELLSRPADLTVISVDAPGYVWKSRAYQLPEEASIDFDLGRRIVKINYSIYLNVLCAGRLPAPVVEWHPEDSAYWGAGSQNVESVLAL